MQSSTKEVAIAGLKQLMKINESPVHIEAITDSVQEAVMEQKMQSLNGGGSNPATFVMAVFGRACLVVYTMRSTLGHFIGR